MAPQPEPPPPDDDGSGITLLRALHAVAAYHTTNTILVDESISSGNTVRRVLRVYKPLSYMRASSGGLGYGIPAAVGAQLARPEARVMALVGDGSAMYAPQALWTAARGGLQIKVVILNNGGYGILKSFNERFFSHLGRSPGLDVPGLDLPTLARSMGVEAKSVSDPDNLDAELERAFASEGPYLLDIRLDTATPNVF